MPRCTVCKIDQPVDRFNRKTRSPSGIRPECRNCQRVAQRGYAKRKKIEDPHWGSYRSTHPTVVGRGWHGARVDPDLPLEFTRDELSVFVGSLLGDASLTYWKRGVTPVLRERKTWKAASYLQWKASILARFKPRLVDHVAKALGKEFPGVFMSTPGCSLFSEWYSVFYHEDRSRCIGERVDLVLDSLAIAVWLQDDGACIWRKNTEQRPGYIICTERFPTTDQARICTVLGSILGGGVRITPRTKSHRVALGADATRRMAELCAPHWQPCMDYKFPYPDLLVPFRKVVV